MIRKHCLTFLVITSIIAAGALAVVIVEHFSQQGIAPVPSVLPTPAANIQIYLPKAGTEVNFPFTVSGQARVFENMFSLRLVEQGTRKLLYQSSVYANASDIGQFGTFEKEINYLSAKPASKDVILEVYDNSAKDGSEIDVVSMPLKLNLGETSTVKVFFGKHDADCGPTIECVYDCNVVFPFNRVIVKTDAPARRALELLLEGPSLADDPTVFTSMNTGVKIQSLVISNGIARADFDEQLEFQMGGSCRVAAISSQIRETLKQFPTVKDVIISINGRTEDILQP